MYTTKVIAAHSGEFSGSQGAQHKVCVCPLLRFFQALPFWIFHKNKANKQKPVPRCSEDKLGLPKTPGLRGHLISLQLRLLLSTVMLGTGPWFTPWVHYVQPKKGNICQGQVQQERYHKQEARFHVPGELSWSMRTTSVQLRCWLPLNYKACLISPVDCNVCRGIRAFRE